MAMGIHSRAYLDNGGGDLPVVTHSPGLDARVQQVKGAQREVEQFRAENPGRATTGSVALTKQREVAERALERQIRMQRGQYPVREAEK